MTQAPPMSPMEGLRPHRGTMILVFGILGLVFCVVFGIVAWVMGNGDLKEMAEGRMDPSGEGMTKAGKICGMISVILAIVGIVLTVLWFIVIAAAVGGAAASGNGP